MYMNSDGSTNIPALRQAVPSAFAESASSVCSERYTYIPTADVIAGMVQNGFMVSSASESRTRIPEKAGHQKHLLRFRRCDVIPTVGGLCPEIVLINSHDGSSSYQLYSGIFRYICANGLVTGGNFDAVKIKHSGDVIRNVIDASFRVIAESTRAIGVAQQMTALELSSAERMLFAEQAHALRFEDQEIGSIIQHDRLLQPRRSADSGTDLFTTLNVIQENVIRGGVRGFGYDGERRFRRVRSRGVNGIDQSTALNRALWTLAERMAEIKAAG